MFDSCHFGRCSNPHGRTERLFFRCPDLRSLERSDSDSGKVEGPPHEELADGSPEHPPVEASR